MELVVILLIALFILLILFVKKSSLVEREVVFFRQEVTRLKARVDALESAQSVDEPPAGAAATPTPSPATPPYTGTARRHW